jgi:hypothetical protein
LKYTILFFILMVILMATILTERYFNSYFNVRTGNLLTMIVAIIIMAAFFAVVTIWERK